MSERGEQLWIEMKRKHDPDNEGGYDEGLDEACELVAALETELARVKGQRDDYHDEVGRVTGERDLHRHQVLTCGIIARRPNIENPIYHHGGKWATAQSEQVRDVVVRLIEERDQLKAELASIRKNGHWTNPMLRTVEDLKAELAEEMPWKSECLDALKGTDATSVGGLIAHLQRELAEARAQNRNNVAELIRHKRGDLEDKAADAGREDPIDGYGPFRDGQPFFPPRSGDQPSTTGEFQGEHDAGGETQTCANCHQPVIRTHEHWSPGRKIGAGRWLCGDGCGKGVPLPCPPGLSEHRKADYHQGDEDCPVAVRRKAADADGEDPVCHCGSLLSEHDQLLGCDFVEIGDDSRRDAGGEAGA